MSNRPPGIIVSGYLTLDKVLEPVFSEASTWCWWDNVQSEPLDSLWLFHDEKNEALADRLHIQIDEFDNYSCSAWKPGFIPKLSPNLIIDEWTYAYGSESSVDAFVNRATEADRLFYTSGEPPDDFLRYLADKQDLFLMHVDGWWEIYDGNPIRRNDFIEHFSSSQIRSWKRFGTPPD